MTAEVTITGEGSPRRRELLQRTLEYVTKQGVSDVSLRPLSAAIGTSPRVLLYLFGSKEGLLREVLALARNQELDAMWRETGAGSGSKHGQLERLWDWLIAEENRPILRLFFEAYVLSLHEGSAWEGMAPKAVEDWLGILRPLVPENANPTLTLAVVRGLMLDLLATGDVERAAAAYREHLRTLSWRPPRLIGRTNG